MKKKKRELLKGYVYDIVKEYLTNDPEVRNWSLYATKLYDPFFSKVKDINKLKKLYKQLMRSPKLNNNHKKAVHYFFHYQKKKLGADYDTKLVKFPAKK